LAEALGQAEKVDASLRVDRASVVFLPAREAPGGRLVGASTGPLGSWEMDVRAYAAAASAGVARAIAAGAKRPRLLVRTVAGDPLIGAVARASYAVPRHHPRIIRLTYEGAGPIERTIFLAGKGVTYDTGGADLKTDGHMAGMSRDKGGAAAIAGLLRVVAER